MRSNCLIFALRLYARRHRRWRRLRLPFDRQPHIGWRSSRLAPHWVPHWHYYERRASGSWRFVSFKPLDPKPLPWWLSWRAVWFCGSIKWGD